MKKKSACGFSLGFTPQNRTYRFWSAKNGLKTGGVAEARYPGDMPEATKADASRAALGIWDLNGGYVCSEYAQ